MHGFNICYSHKEKLKYRLTPSPSTIPSQTNDGSNYCSTPPRDNKLVFGEMVWRVGLMDGWMGGPILM